MRDPRIQQLAQRLIRYSVNLQKGEKILIDIYDHADDFAVALVEAAYEAGGIPFVNQESNTIKRALLMNATKEQMDALFKYELLRMQDMNAYIAVRKSNNITELSDVPEDKMNLYNEFYGRLHLEHRVKHTKWCVLRYPSSSMAQQAGMSTEAFEDYYFAVCGLDYEKLRELMLPLKELMDKTDRVRIVAKDTDLEFSIKGRESGICCGKANIPDGEICLAPIKESVNGTITYNVPSNFHGFTYQNISFTFKDGKIVRATANDTERINKVLDIDLGARYIGEFAIGVNPYMDRHITDTLFDEKMTGSIHFTPGSGGDNVSSIHWDIIQCHTPAYGGGSIYFDGKLIRKDGLFTDEALSGLNPENFKKSIRI
jgi:aminopeptidase